MKLSAIFKNAARRALELSANASHPRLRSYYCALGFSASARFLRFFPERPRPERTEPVAVGLDIDF